MYIVQKLNETFCRHQLDLWCDLHLGFLYIFFCLNDQPTADSMILMSPTTIMLEFIYILQSFRVCLMKLGALMLSAYRSIIVIYF
jgi:hypothetical protein